MRKLDPTKGYLKFAHAYFRESIKFPPLAPHSLFHPRGNKHHTHSLSLSKMNAYQMYNISQTGLLSKCSIWDCSCTSWLIYKTFFITQCSLAFDTCFATDLWFALRMSRASLQSLKPTKCHRVEGKMIKLHIILLVKVKVKFSPYLSNTLWKRK
jgi:hypothetical protein